MKTAVGAFALCVYVHRHRCALSICLDRVHPVLLHMQVWRRFLLLLTLVAKGFPRTSIGKGNASDRFPTPFFLIANQLSYPLSCDEAGLESK